MDLEPLGAIFSQAQKHTAEQLRYLKADFEVFGMLLGCTVGLKKHEQTTAEIGYDFHTAVWRFCPSYHRFTLEELERLRANDLDGGRGHEIAVLFVSNLNV